MLGCVPHWYWRGRRGPACTLGAVWVAWLVNWSREGRTPPQHCQSLPYHCKEANIITVHVAGVIACSTTLTYVPMHTHTCMYVRNSGTHIYRTTYVHTYIHRLVLVQLQHIITACTDIHVNALVAVLTYPRS